MKNILKKKIIERSLLACASFLCVFSALTDVAIKNESQINKSLGIKNDIKSDGDDDSIYFKRDYTDENELKNYLSETGKEVEGEGLVLLKNDNNALPLTSGSKVSLLFNGSVNFNYATSGSSKADTTSYKDLKTSLTDAGLEVNNSLWDYVKNDLSKFKRTTKGANYKVKEAGLSDYSKDVLNTIDEYSNVIFTISRDSGEGKDINTKNADTVDGSYLSLSEQEIEMLKEMTTLKKAGKVKKIIVLLNSSQMIQVDFLKNEGIEVDAMLWVGNVGTYGIDAVSEALTGTINPSGRMSDTLLYENFSSPAMASWIKNPGQTFSQAYANADGLNDTQSHYGVNVEGIYVGYRYYETRYYDYVTGRENVGDFDYSSAVAYPFGTGLSYADFTYSDMTVTTSDDGKSFDVSVKVKNTGSVKGKETVQVYLNKPYTDYDKDNLVEKSSVELVGFAKTKELNPNEEETLNIIIEKEDFKSYDSNKAKTYILDDGDYHLIVGKDSHDAVNNLLSYEGKTVANTSNKMDDDGNSEFVFTYKQGTFDATTYSVSSHTKNKITNLFDEADINKYSNRGDNSVTYVSRNDWSGTYPTAAATITLNDGIKADLSSNKTIVENGEEMPKYNQDNGLTLAELKSTEENPIAYDDEKYDQLLDQMSYGDQSLLITSGQFSTPALTSISKPATAEDDGPTGLASTKTSTSFPSEGIWASTFNTELIQKLGDAFGEDCINSSITGIYAGGVNIHRTPFGGRNHEYFSEDPVLSGLMSVAEIKGLQNKGVITHIKHLAFNEEESSRNGISMFLNEQEAREILLKPFEYSLAIDEGNSHAVMSGFNRVGSIWAGADSNLQKTLLRDEWGFDGYVITDMASSNGAYYMTYQDGFMNGTNLFLGSGGSDKLDSFKSSAAFANNVRESAHRILYVICNYSYAMNGYKAGDQVSVKSPWWKVTLLSITYTLVGLTVLALVLYIAYYVLKLSRK